MVSADTEVTDNPVVTFLSDYGLDDHFVGVCKGAIAKLAPSVRIIDICHQVAAQNVEIGARLLAEAVPYLPVGVHLALVDPYHRVQRRAVAIRCAEGSVIVAPDNGLASLAWVALGGIEAAYEITNRELWHANPSASFRGRDVLAPVSARLATGLDVTRVGERIEPASLQTLKLRPPYVHSDHVHGAVRIVDHFGNLQLTITRADLEVAGIALGDTVELRVGGRAMSVPFTLSFADVPVGGTFVYEDSFRSITIVTNMGRATSALRAEAGDPVVIARVATPRATASAQVKVVDSPPSAATA